MLIWVFLHAVFISALKTQPKSIIFEKHPKNGKKSIYHHYFLFFVIFSKILKQKCLIPTESCFLDGKKPNIAKLVDINVLADYEKNCQAIVFAKMEGQMAFFCKSYENVLIWVFLNAEFISARKTEPKSMVFEKHAKSGKKNICHHYFLFFVIFSKSLKQKCLIPNESCFLDGKKLNTAKLVYINFLADNEKNRQATGFAKMEG